MLTVVAIFSGAESEFSVAEVRLQPGGLHSKSMPQAEGDARPGLHEHGAAASRDFQAEQLTERKDERVREAAERAGEHKGAGPGADADAGAAGRLLRSGPSVAATVPLKKA